MAEPLTIGATLLSSLGLISNPKIPAAPDVSRDVQTPEDGTGNSEASPLLALSRILTQQGRRGGVATEGPPSLASSLLGRNQISF